MLPAEVASEPIQWFSDPREDKKNTERVKKSYITTPIDSISSRRGHKRDELGSISRTACLGSRRMKYRSHLETGSTWDSAFTIWMDLWMWRRFSGRSLRSQMLMRIWSTSWSITVINNFNDSITQGKREVLRFFAILIGFVTWRILFTIKFDPKSTSNYPLSTIQIPIIVGKNISEYF